MQADTAYRLSQGRIDRLEVENFKSYRGHQARLMGRSAACSAHAHAKQHR